MRSLSLYTMVLFYVMAGINHFWHPRSYKKIMPPYLPFPEQWVYASGVCEILFALLLIPTDTRWVAAWLIIGLLIAIFPANIQMTLNYSRRHHPHTWLTILRLPIQLLLIAWAWAFTKHV